jgi:hypothetical protein
MVKTGPYLVELTSGKVKTVKSTMPHCGLDPTLCCMFTLPSFTLIIILMLRIVESVVLPPQKFTIAEMGERQGKLANRPYLKELAN